MATVSVMQIAWLVEFPGYTPPAGAADAPTRFWSGEGPLEFAVDGTTRTWAGTLFGERATVQATPMQAVREGAPARLKVRIDVGSEADTLRHMILAEDPGPRPVRVRFLRRAPGAASWTLTSRQYYGRLSNGDFVNGSWQYELETYSGDADRQDPKQWSNEHQQARHPGDRGLEFTADLAQGREIRWGSG